MKPRVGYVRTVARKLLDKHGIKQPPVDLQKLVEDEGLEYDEVDYFPDEVDAMIIPIEGRIVAAVNVNQAPNRRKFSLAHELGHHFLHQDRSVLEERITIDSGHERTCGKSKDVYEVEADMFASELLIPLAFLKSIYKKGMSIPEVAEIFMVSEAAASVAVSQHFNSLF